MKTILTILMIGLIGSSILSTAHATTTELGYRILGDRHAPVNAGGSLTWYHNTGDMADIAGTGERTEVQTAFNTWQNDVASYIQFTNSGTTANTANQVFNPGSVPDGTNVMQYNANLGCGTSCPIAVTGWHSVGSTYDDIDTAFNDAHITFSNTNPTPTGQIDLQSNALHEIGHWLILEDLFDNTTTSLNSCGSNAGPSGNTAQIMLCFLNFATQKRTLSWGDQSGVRYLFANTNPAGTSIGSETQDEDLATGLVNSGSVRDYVLAWADNPSGANTIKYSYSMDISSTTGQGGSWTTPVSISGVGSETQGVGVAIHQLNGTAAQRPELIIAWIDNPSGNNNIKYRIGWDIDTSGVPKSWSVDKTVDSTNVGTESQGLGISFVDTPDTGTSPEMFVFWVDNPFGANTIYYKVGWNINTSGDPTGGTPWSTRITPGIAPGDETQGLGTSIDGSFIGNTNQDITVFWIDNPFGDNHGYYRVGQDVTSTGTFSWTAARDTFPNDWQGVGTESQGAGVAVFDANSDGRLEASFSWIDNPSGANSGKLRTEWGGKMGSGSHS